MPFADELAEYLKLQQLTGSMGSWEWAGLQWWERNAKKFPNLVACQCIELAAHRPCHTLALPSPLEGGLLPFACCRR